MRIERREGEKRGKEKVCNVPSFILIEGIAIPTRFFPIENVQIIRFQLFCINIYEKKRVMEKRGRIKFSRSLHILSKLITGKEQ